MPSGLSRKMTEANTDTYRPSENRFRTVLVRLLLLVMTLEGAYLLWNRQWLSLFLVLLVIFTLLAPIVFKKRLQVVVPAEFHLSAVLFSFAALYLGEIQQFYQRLWWWDIALHTSAGLLMGIIGFLLVYILNETERVRLNLTNGFIAFFAFLFAIFIGTCWEIFEFIVDSLLSTNMQKPMLGDPSGLTDTMWDMIVNAIGAFVISFAGWWYLSAGESFFVDRWIQNFIERNPRLFKQK